MTEAKVQAELEGGARLERVYRKGLATMATLICAGNGLSSCLTLVLLEDGARLPRVVCPCDEGSELVVVAQATDEQPVDFAVRALERIRMLEARAKTASRAVLAVGSTAVGAPRCLAARGLLRHLMRAGGGTLLISARRKNDHQRRQQIELLAFAGSLLCEFGSDPVAVRVCFDDSWSTCRFGLTMADVGAAPP